jgi:hypothetical protein
VAGATQASGQVEPRNHIENVGKSALDETGKDPVNKNVEEIFAGSVSLRDSCASPPARHSGARGSADPESRDSGFHAVGIAPE